MIIRTNLDYLADEINDYNRYFYDKVFRLKEIPSEKDIEEYANKPFLLHPSGVRQVLPYEFGQNRDSLTEGVFERYCKIVMSVVEGTRSALEPFRDFYDSTYHRISLSHYNSLFWAVENYLLAVSDLENKVMFFHAELVRNKKDGDLSASEIALKHWYLVKAGAEDYIVPKQVGEKYGALRNAKNIEKEYGKLDKLKSNEKPSTNRKHLVNVIKSLNEHPQIQKAVINDLDTIE